MTMPLAARKVENQQTISWCINDHSNIIYCVITFMGSYYNIES